MVLKLCVAIDEAILTCMKQNGSPGVAGSLRNPHS